MPLHPMSRIVRYFVVGVINTAISYGVYLVTLHFIDYRVAYTLAYATGLAGGYWANARFVFGAAPGAHSAVGYLVSYAATYVVSLATLWVAVECVGMPRPLAMGASLVIAVPVSYWLLQHNFSRPARLPDGT